jgi:general secretion pathway protein G
MGKYGLKSVSVCLSVPLTHLDRAPIYKQRSAGPCHGFTLIEILIAILIVLTLAGIAVPLFADYLHKAKVDRAVLDIRTMEKEIILFELEKGRYPGWSPTMLETMQEIGRDYFKDPWGTPYQYRNLAQGPHTGGGKPQFCRRDRSYNPLNYDFDLYSVGPDRQVPTHNQITANKGADDIVRAANGRYVGVGAKF